MASSDAADFPNFTEWSLLLPFYQQGDVNEAVRIFKGIEATTDDPLIKARAKAWRSYCYLTVLLDGWRREDWGSGEDRMDEKALRTLALDLAREAKQAFPKDYDILWAFAYALFFVKDKKEKASRILDRAIRLLPEDQSGLLAEAADLYVYQGKVFAALRSIYEALARDAALQRRSPDWYYWVQAWVLFNGGLLEEEAGDVEAAETSYRAALQALRQMKRSENDQRFDFDALLLRAALHLKLRDEAGRSKAIERFQRKTELRKGRDWSRALERNRARYNTKEGAEAPDQAADILQRRWNEVVEQLLPA